MPVLGSVSEQLAERIEAVLHRHMLHAAVLAVGGRAHEFQRLVARALLERDPGGDRQNLLFRAVGPIGLVGFFERRPQRLDGVDQEYLRAARQL